MLKAIFAYVKAHVVVTAITTTVVVGTAVATPIVVKQIENHKEEKNNTARVDQIVNDNLDLLIKENEENVYLSNANGELYILDENDNSEIIHSHITTFNDNCGYDSYTKTTNKKGAEIDVKVKGNDDIKVYATINGKEVLIGTYNDEKGYIILKKKLKKFKEINFKISSEKPFGIFSMTFEAFIAGYLKR